MWRTCPVTLDLESMYTTSAGTNTFETGLADVRTHPVVDVARFKGGQMLGPFTRIKQAEQAAMEDV